MALIQFTRNHTDHSTDKGFQFEFFCDRCGNGFMSEFKTSATGMAKYHRYAIAARRLPELRQVRASFLGRAIHSSFEAWQKQVASILAKAGV